MQKLIKKTEMPNQAWSSSDSSPSSTAMSSTPIPVSSSSSSSSSSPSSSIVVISLRGVDDASSILDCVAFTYVHLSVVLVKSYSPAIFEPQLRTGPKALFIPKLPDKFHTITRPFDPAADIEYRASGQNLHENTFPYSRNGLATYTWEQDKLNENVSA